MHGLNWILKDKSTSTQRTGAPSIQNVSQHAPGEVGLYSSVPSVCKAVIAWNYYEH